MIKWKHENINPTTYLITFRRWKKLIQLRILNTHLFANFRNLDYNLNANLHRRTITTAKDLRGEELYDNMESWKYAVEKRKYLLYDVFSKSRYQIFKTLHQFTRFYTKIFTTEQENNNSKRNSKIPIGKTEIV